ncbi:MAG: hypothetical protein KDD62_02155 [Bdellovibrionales bacterium]|nr:hypothetical protein [Bdellovibrionales bacterium]
MGPKDNAQSPNEQVGSLIKRLQESKGGEVSEHEADLLSAYFGSTEKAVRTAAALLRERNRDNSPQE